MGKVESGPDRRVYKVTKSGAEVLQRGLETIIRREPFIDGLIAFYKERFKEKGEWKT